MPGNSTATTPPPSGERFPVPRTAWARSDVRVPLDHVSKCKEPWTEVGLGTGQDFFIVPHPQGLRGNVGASWPAARRPGRRAVPGAPLRDSRWGHFRGSQFASLAGVTGSRTRDCLPVHEAETCHPLVAVGGCKVAIPAQRDHPVEGAATAAEVKEQLRTDARANSVRPRQVERHGQAGP